VNRRAFAESLAVAALAPVLGVPAEVLRLDLRSPGASPSVDGAEASAAEDSTSMTLALAEIIRLRYGARLSGDELAAITHQIQAGLDRADLIRHAEQGRGA
jgi:hypothetical protein